MKRCPACGTVYSVAQGYCPMDGAPLSETAAAAGTPAAAVAPVVGAWDRPGVAAGTEGSGGPMPATSGVGSTAGGFGAPPQARPLAAGQGAAPAGIPMMSDRKSVV